MADIVDQFTRSRMMARIQAKDTRPELVLRRALHAEGFRYRLHAYGLPGRPDLLFPKFRGAVFVHGCFWHRHDGCRFATTPGTRPEFWRRKFAGNVARDLSARLGLRSAGWRVATVWECALRKPAQVAVAADLLAAWLLGHGASLSIEADALGKVLERDLD